MFLLQHNILHEIVSLFFGLLIVLLFVRWILSWFRLPDSNPIMLFLNRTTDPVILPFRKRIPPVAFLDMSWFFAWAFLTIFRIVFLQALPPGW